MARFLSLLSSVVLHAMLLALACSPVLLEHEAVPIHDLRLATADHVIVLCDEPLVEEDRPIEEYETVVCDPVIRDAKLDDDTEHPNGTIGLAGPPSGEFSDSCFEGAATNGLIGIGGGAGGAFGGRWGGRRNLRAGGGGRMAGAGRMVPGAILPAAPQLLGRVGRDGATHAFPLRPVAVDADVSGWVASTELRQRYENPFDTAIEATYVMPLPTGIAINGFVMEIADRRVVGIVKPREEALKIYEEARARGQTASLMSQDRPNVFRQSVANIAPGESVDVTITYFHALAYSDGAFEYVFPMVVAPRYDPGRGTDGGTGPGTGATVTQPAAGVATRVLPPGVRSGRDVDIALTVDAGMPIQDVRCPTHEAEIRPDGANRVHVTLTPKEAIPDRDFVLRWFVADDETTAGVVAHRDPDGATGGFFSVLLVPKLDPGEADLSAREVTFVIDSSGSMNGVPINTCKRLVEKTLRGMRPYDRFNVIQFAGGSGTMADAPVEATPENVERGALWARTRIEDVEDELLGSQGDTRAALEREIEDLGMDFGLITRRTSYVAVDEARTVGDGRPVRILQPHELPVGVRVRDVRHLNAVLADVQRDRVALGYRNGAGNEIRAIEVDRP